MTWEEVTLGDLLKTKHANLQTGPFGTALKADEYVKTGIPVIAVKDIESNKLNHESLVYVTEETATRLSKYEVKAGDIIFGRKGSVDRRALIRDDENGWIQGSDCIRLRLASDISSEYISYQLGSNKIKAWMLSNAGGTTMPSLNQDILSRIPLILPPLETQKKIAAVLSSLDDKIELNTRMNKVLEEIAQVIFKRWFVEFEFPNEKGEPYRSSGGKMKESELGLIPEGWGVISVDDPIDVNPSVSLTKGTRSAYVDMASLPINCGSISDVSYKEYTGGSKFSNGDVLLARITPCLENGKTAFVDFLKEGEIGFGSTEFIVLRGKGEVKTSFVYCLARYSDFRKHCIASMVGSSGRQRVQNDCFKNYLLAHPSDTVLKAFDNMCGVLFKQITINTQNSIRLIELRDSLLPKLMNGEIHL